MMGLRLQVVLEHMPVGPDAILRYVRRVGDPPQVSAPSWAVGLGDLREPERSERGSFVVFSFSAPFHRHFLRSQWKFRDQRELPLSLRYQGEVEEPADMEWRAGRKGWRLRNLKPGSSHCLTPSGRMLPRPLEQQQKRPCPEAHLLLLRGAPETNRMALPLRQNLGQLQSPQ